MAASPIGVRVTTPRSNRSPVILTPIRVRVTTLGPTSATILTIRVEQNPFDLPSSGGNGTS